MIKQNGVEFNNEKTVITYCKETTVCRHISEKMKEEGPISVVFRPGNACQENQHSIGIDDGQECVPCCLMDGFSISKCPSKLFQVLI